MFISLSTALQQAGDLQVPIQANFGEGTVNIGSMRIELVPQKGKRLTSQSEEWKELPTYILDFVGKCTKSPFNWSARLDNNGDGPHFFNCVGDYIGGYDVARALCELRINNPKPATSSDATDREFNVHLVCSVGFSNVLDSWVSWGFGSFMTAPSETEACSYSCLNSMVSLRNTMELKKYLLNTLNFGDIIALHEKAKNDGGTTPKTYVTAHPDSTEPQVGDVADSVGTALTECSNPEPTCTETPVLEANYENQESAVVAEAAPANHQRSTVAQPYFLRSGEHRQHNIHTPSRQRRSNMPYSGEHKQHHIPKINENPGYSMSQEATASSKGNVGAYLWKRYTPAGGRAKHFKEHHRSYELTLEDKAIYGYREGRGNVFYVVDADDLSIEFKLSDKEVQLLVKNSVDYRGKVQGVDVKALVAATTPKVSKQAVKAGSPTARTGFKPMEKFSDMEDIFVGFYQSSAFVQDYDVLFHTNKAAIVKEIRQRVSEIKQAIPSAVIVQMPGSSTFVQQNWNKKNPRIAKAIGDSLIQRSTGKALKMDFATNMQNYTQKPRTPKVGFKYKQPIYFGNELEVLRELRLAIIEGYFTRELSPAKITKTKVTVNTDPQSDVGLLTADPARLVLVTSNPSPMFFEEAKNTLERIRRDYGRWIRGKVSQYQVGDEEVTSLILAVALPKREPADVKRSRLIHTMVNNMGAVQGVRTILDQINKLEAEITTLSKALGDVAKDKGSAETQRLGQMMATSDKLKKELHEALSSNALILNAPVYAIKVGKIWLSVEVVDYNIAEGTVTIRQVRGGNRDKQVVKDLWLYQGSKKII